MRFTDLAAGYEFPAVAFHLDAASVVRYLAATDDDDAIYWRDGSVALVPPLGVAALAFRDIAGQVALQPGSLHTGQELSFHRAVRVGEHLTTRARVAASSKRRGFTAMIVELAALDAADAAVLSGRMTLMVAPADGDDSDPAGFMAGPARMAAEPARLATRAYVPLPAGELVAGRDLGAIARTVTQQRIDRYAGASGDYNPIHVDPDLAARSPFGSTVAHGMLLLAYLSSLLTRAAGEAWLAGGELKVKFRVPAPAASTVTAVGQVEHREGDAHGVQYAVCAVRLESPAGDALITGQARVPIG